MTHPPIDPERIELLAALSAIGAASPEERAEFDMMRDSIPNAAALGASFDDTAAALALSLAPIKPPANAIDSIRRRIKVERSRPIATIDPANFRPLSHAERPPRAQPRGKGKRAPQFQDEDTEIVNLSTHRRAKQRAPGPRWVNVAATTAALAAVALGVLWIRGQSEMSNLRAQLMAAEKASENLRDDLAVAQTSGARAQQQLAQVTNQLALAERQVDHFESPSLRLATLAVAPTNGAPKAKIFIDPERRKWLVLAYDLPAIDLNRQDYQLWFLPRIGGAAPMPAGLLTQRDDGVFEAEIDLPPDLDVAQAAISLEKKGGVEVPTDVKMAGPLI